MVNLFINHPYESSRYSFKETQSICYKTVERSSYEMFLKQLGYVYKWSIHHLKWNKILIEKYGLFVFVIKSWAFQN